MHRIQTSLGSARVDSPVYNVHPAVSEENWFVYTKVEGGVSRLSWGSIRRSPWCCWRQIIAQFMLTLHDDTDELLSSPFHWLLPAWLMALETPSTHISLVLEIPHSVMALFGCVFSLPMLLHWLLCPYAGVLWTHYVSIPRVLSEGFCEVPGEVLHWFFEVLADLKQTIYTYSYRYHPLDTPLTYSIVLRHDLCNHPSNTYHHQSPHNLERESTIRMSPHNLERVSTVRMSLTYLLLLFFLPITLP